MYAKRYIEPRSPAGTRRQYHKQHDSHGERSGVEPRMILGNELDEDPRQSEIKLEFESISTLSRVVADLQSVLSGKAGGMSHNLN